MNKKQIILVTGATGAQGGSVARMLFTENNFTVRCLTRNARSKNALALQNLGAEIIEGDMDDIESLKIAMQDCYGVFGVTNFWEHFEKEYIHGKNLVDAVKESNISHFVFSTLPDYNTLTKGALSAPHVDIKATLEKYARSLNLHSTFVHIAFYYENFLTFFKPQPGEDGNFFFGFPQGDTKLGGVTVEDTGGVIAAIFNNPSKYIGRTVKVTGDNQTCTEYAATMSKILKRTIRYVHIPRETYAAFNFPGAEDLANMFEVQRLYINDNEPGLQESYDLNKNMQTFEQWLINNAHLFSFLDIASNKALIK